MPTPSPSSTASIPPFAPHPNPRGFVNWLLALAQEAEATGDRPLAAHLLEVFYLELEHLLAVPPHWQTM